ncbi:MAG: hypothetical protein ACI9YB_002124, partial [Halioglobus sp.]
HIFSQISVTQWLSGSVVIYVTTPLGNVKRKGSRQKKTVELRGRRTTVNKGGGVTWYGKL